METGASVERSILFDSFRVKSVMLHTDTPDRIGSRAPDILIDPVEPVRGLINKNGSCLVVVIDRALWRT